jgi:soluble lytic murein transglycosylase-like protein
MNSGFKKLTLGIMSAAALLLTSQAPLPAQEAIPSLTFAASQSQNQRQLTLLARRHKLAAMSEASMQTRVVRAVVLAKARDYGVPREIAMGISGHESGGWKMWQGKDVIQNSNHTAAGLHSIDWGVMQLNDRAHPGAFPRARQDLAYNIEYGMRYLADLHKVYQGSLNQGFGNWDLTLAAYNLGHSPLPEELPIATRYLQKTQAFLKASRIPFSLHYTVQPGDSLQSIASNRLGQTSRWQAIWQANQAVIRSPEALRAGQKLLLPVS